MAHGLRFRNVGQLKSVWNFLIRIYLSYLYLFPGSVADPGRNNDRLGKQQWWDSVMVKLDRFTYNSREFGLAGLEEALFPESRHWRGSYFILRRQRDDDEETFLCSNNLCLFFLFVIYSNGLKGVNRTRWKDPIIWTPSQRCRSSLSTNWNGGNAWSWPEPSSTYKLAMEIFEQLVFVEEYSTILESHNLNWPGLLLK